MNCRHCGAALPIGAERCEYCGAATPHAADNLETILREKKRKGLLSMKRVSGGMLFFLYFFTVGVYGSVWHVLRNKSLNRLAPNIQIPLWAACLQLALHLGWILIPQSSVGQALGLSEENVQDCFNLLSLAAFILSIWLSFKARSILQLYASRYLEKSVAVLSIAPSGLMIFLFGPLYLQDQINRMIAMELLNPDL